MKILFISGGDYKYGAPKSMMTMAESLRDIYHIDIVLLTKRKNLLNEYCDQHGIENYSFWYRDIMAGSPYTSKILTIAKHLVKYLAYLWGGVTMHMINRLPIDFSTIDIIHSNTNRQDIGGYLASKYKIKHIWHIREMGKEDYNVIFYKSHCISYMNEHADAFIMISDAVRDKWQQIGIDANKVYTLYDGMECKEITKHLTKGKKSKNKVRIVITGHVQPNKGQLHLVQAIARLPVAIKNTVELDIIGEAYPDYKKEIEKQIKSLSSETTSSLTNEAEQATNALGRTGGAIKGLRDAVDGDTLSYYIWTDKDEIALISAQSRLTEINRILAEGGPEAQKYGSEFENCRGSLETFISEYEKLRDTRQVTEDTRLATEGLNTSLQNLSAAGSNYGSYFDDVISNSNFPHRLVC